MIVDQVGRAIARWNRIDVKMIMSWEIFASRAPYARSAQKCIIILNKLAPNGSFETWTVRKSCRVSQTNDLVEI